MDSRPGEKTFSQMYRVRSGYVTSVAMLTVGVILALSLPVRAFQEDLDPALKVSSLLVFLGVVALLRRATKTSVRLGARDIEVVNPLSRKKLAWKDIREFSLGYPEGFLNDRCAVVETKDGTRHPISAASDRTYFGQSPVPTPASVIVEELSAALEKARVSGGELNQNLISTDGPDRIWRMPVSRRQ